MSKQIEIKYTTDAIYKEKKGFHVIYEYETGMMGAFDAIPQDAILILPVLADGEIYDSQRALRRINEFVTTEDATGYTFEEIRVVAPQAKEVKISDINSTEAFDAMMKDHNSVLIIDGVTKTETKTNEEATTMEKSIVIEATTIATATPATTTTTKIEEATTMTNVQAIAKELGITEEQIAEAAAKMEQSQMAEALDFIAQESVGMEKELLEKTIIKEDDQKLLKFMQIALGNIAKDKTKSVDVKAKASAFGTAVKENGIKFFGWAKEQGLKLLGFLWGAIKFVWKHASAIVKATIGFGGDIISILFRHAGEILGEVSQSAQVRYAPVFAK